MSNKSTHVVFNATIENSYNNNSNHIHKMVERKGKSSVVEVIKNIDNSSISKGVDFQLESSDFNLADKIKELIVNNDLSKSIVLYGYDSIGPLFVTACSLKDLGFNVSVAKTATISPNGYEMTSSLHKAIQRALGKRALK